MTSVEKITILGGMNSMALAAAHSIMALEGTGELSAEELIREFSAAVARTVDALRGSVEAIKS